MRDYYFFILMLSVGLSACDQRRDALTYSKASYHEIDFPDSLSLFAPDLISTPLKERDFALSPDGKTILYTQSVLNSSFSAIVEMRLTSKGWSSPVIADFSGKFSDLEPAYAPDGKT
ncbi:MAG: hypothetical protein AAFO69_00870, partial [Bacteroidota bacterium]